MQLTKHLSFFLAGLAVASLLGQTYNPNARTGHDKDMNLLEPWRVGRFTSQAFPDQQLIYVTDTASGQVVVLKPAPPDPKFPDSKTLSFVPVGITKPFEKVSIGHHILNPQ
jgi:hypothetical protein